MRTDDLLEPSIRLAPAYQVDREAGSERAAIAEGFAVNRGGETELQQETSHVLGQLARRRGVENRTRPPVNAAVALKQLGDQNAQRPQVPVVHERGNLLFEGSLPLQPALLEEEPHRS